MYIILNWWSNIRLSKLKTDTRILVGSKTYEKREAIFSHDFYDQTIVGIVLLMSLQLCNSGIPIFFLS